MLLHVRIRPDGNGSIYTGTPEELKKRFTALRRSWEHSENTPFIETHRIEVMQTGSGYYMMNDGGGLFSICKKGKHSAYYIGHSYSSFSGAINKLQKLIESEGK